MKQNIANNASSTSRVSAGVGYNRRPPMATAKRRVITVLLVIITAALLITLLVQFGWYMLEVAFSAA